MMIDSSLVFDMGTYAAATGMIGVNQFASGATTTSTNVLDMTNNRDVGAARSGVAPLTVCVLVTTAFSGGTSVNVQLQGSTDNVTYTVYSETGAVPIASMTAGALLTLPLPSVNPDSGAAPRYYRLQYVNVGANTAGAVISWLGTVDNMRYYKPGITVSN